MLDKSIPYHEVWMRRPPTLAVPAKQLSTGFKLVTYQIGDEQAWGTIEASVLEFATTEEALAYFQRTFVPEETELAQRMFFIESSAGEKVATCTAWWKTLANGQEIPLLHWLAVKPDFQGQGLASVLVSIVTQKLQDLSKDQPIYLHTQTWSHQAIGLYQKFGYQLIPTDPTGNPNSEFTQVKQILSELAEGK